MIIFQDNLGHMQKFVERGCKNAFLQISGDSLSEVLFFGDQYSQSSIRGFMWCYRCQHNYFSHFSERDMCIGVPLHTPQR